MGAMGWFADGWGWAGWWGTHMLGGFLFWLIVIVAAALLVRQLANGGPGPDGGESPLEILKKRYAGGEINRDEFDLKRRDLQA